MRNIDLIWLKEIDSTNSLAARELLANPDIPQWRVWAAEYQSAGKGQRGNRWVGEPGCNLAFTILLRPHNLPAVKQFALSQVCALGVCNYLERYHNISAEIKWPNDIYVGNSKICGMLLENSLASGGEASGGEASGKEGPRVGYCIAGIGININQVQFDPASTVNPTSLLLESGQERYDIKVEQERVLLCIYELYQRLEAGNLAAIEQEYFEHLYRRNGWHLFEELAEGEVVRGLSQQEMRNRRLSPVTLSQSAGECTGKVIEAKIAGIDDAANLLLEQRDGTIKAYAFKEVRFIIEK